MGVFGLTNMLPHGGNGRSRSTSMPSIPPQNVTGWDRRRSSAPTHRRAPVRHNRHPGQGAAVSGTITVFGWALTPGPNIIAPMARRSRSSWTTVVGQRIHQCRGQRQSAPRRHVQRRHRGGVRIRLSQHCRGRGRLARSSGTTTLSNGIHSIAWLVFDSAGKRGIGADTSTSKMAGEDFAWLATRSSRFG